MVFSMKSPPVETKTFAPEAESKCWILLVLETHGHHMMPVSRAVPSLHPGGLPDWVPVTTVNTFDALSMVSSEKLMY
jgi:hypothetical protein